MKQIGFVFLFSVLASACSSNGGGESPPPPEEPPADPPEDPEELVPASENWSHDVDLIDLRLDLAELSGIATITTASAADGVSLEIGDLAIRRVSAGGEELDFRVEGGRLDIGVLAGDTNFTVEYDFVTKAGFDGWMPESGVSFLWPTFCSNLFPCISNPADGFRLDVDVKAPSADVEMIFPTSIAAEAPSYMFAVAVGDFESADLGTTAAGTSVGVHYELAVEADSLAGTMHLKDVVDFFETTYGDYLFGDNVASVSANWGGGDYGGMEHHPFWHVSSGSMYSEEVHAHEAAHGWYGNGVRIECWEDFVLSEGVATYLAARGLGAQGVDLWPDYECGLKYVCESAAIVVLPDSTCNAIDIINDPLWSGAPYMKGAYFLRAVADEIGEDVLDTALAEFYADNAGGAARMQQLIDHIKTKGEAEAIETLVTNWLRTEACPVDTTSFCPDPEPEDGE